MTASVPPHQNNTPDAPFDALENALHDALSRSDPGAAGAFDDNATNLCAAVESPGDEVLTPAARRPSGWLVGMALGVLIGLCLLPPVRYTLGSQLRFALAQDGLPWVLSLDSERTLREAPRLDATAATLPDDYLLQVGRATAFVELGGVRAAPIPKVDHPDNTADTSDHTLIRLTRVAHDFPVAAGAQAHLARYMMVDRVRIQRAELSQQTEKEKRRKGEEEKQGTGDRGQGTGVPQFTIGNRQSAMDSSFILHPSSFSTPARYTDVKLMRMALSNGERLDPDNVFWPAMLAATYFAAGRDTQALDALARCDTKTRWDSYIYEEILGQWRLYSLAYGDHGATQKIGPLSVIAFPHLRELRRMAEMARWYSDQEARRGNVREALQIRHHLLRLGALLRETATWAYEALYGTDLTLIAASDNDATPRQTTVRTVEQWQQQAQGYLDFLRTNGKLSEITLLTTEVEESCKLRAQVDGARADASYPGIPPGIPLIALFGSWMTGVCLVQQLLLLAGCGMAAWLLRKSMQKQTRLPRAMRLLAWFLVSGTVLISGFFLLTGLLSSRLAIVFLIGSGCLFVLISGNMQHRWWQCRRRKWRGNVQLSEEATSADTVATAFSEWQPTRVEQRWHRGTTGRLLFFLLSPYLAALWFLRPLLSGLHPVAQLLTSLMGMEPATSFGRVFQVALLSCAMPLMLVTGLCLWALWRRVPVLAAVTIGMRRVLLPAAICIALAYLILLQQTLSLDTESTHAINEVARDDMHWVLTHSEGR